MSSTPITLYVNNAEKTEKITCFRNENLLSVLQRAHLAPSAPCGGMGKCKKCRVIVTVSDEDREILSCQTKVYDGMQIRLFDEGEGRICSDFSFMDNSYTPDGNGYGIALDLGTTTLAAELIDLSTGKKLAAVSAMNAQKPYGADVISRTKYIMDNPKGLDTLNGIILEQIVEMKNSLAEKAGISCENLLIFVAGNTIMQHIAANLSPESIAKAPFTPQTLFHEGSLYNNILFSPCAAGYVGGDITAGIIAVGLNNKDKTCLFVDLGTNGEMAIGSKEEIICCSVASGPAFEGAGITCGMPGLTGAINHIEYKNGIFEYTTIGNVPPKGICGSGIIELTACLLDMEIIDETGYLLPPDEVDGDFSHILGEDEDGNGIVYITEDKSVYFTARDVRQIQLAKAAVAAGIDILMSESGKDFDDIEALYLAGGFGNFISVPSAAKIGLLPHELAGKTVSVGNSSLGGAELALSVSKAKKELFALPKTMKYIELSTDSRFNDLFAEKMYFE